jgi:hypothetical protein
MELLFIAVVRQAYKTYAGQTRVKRRSNVSRAQRSSDEISYLLASLRHTWNTPSAVHFLCVRAYFNINVFKNTLNQTHFLATTKFAACVWFLHHLVNCRAYVMAGMLVLFRTYYVFHYRNQSPRL